MGNRTGSVAPSSSGVESNHDHSADADAAELNAEEVVGPSAIVTPKLKARESISRPRSGSKDVTRERGGLERGEPGSDRSDKRFEFSDQLHAQNWWADIDKDAGPLAYLSHYFAYSTAHGFRGIFEDSSMFRRAYWVIAVSICIGLVVYMLTGLVATYTLFETVTNVAIEEVIEADFPDITICNLNKYKFNSVIDPVSKYLDKSVGLKTCVQSSLESNVDLTLEEEYFVRGKFEKEEWFKNWGGGRAATNSASGNGTFVSAFQKMLQCCTGTWTSHVKWEELALAVSRFPPILKVDGPVGWGGGGLGEEGSKYCFEKDDLIITCEFKGQRCGKVCGEKLGESTDEADAKDKRDTQGARGNCAPENKDVPYGSWETRANEKYCQCQTFRPGSNTAPDEEAFKITGGGNAKDNRLELVVNVNSFDFWPSDSQAHGLRVAIHKQGTVADMENGFSIGPGKLAMFSITKREFHRLKPKWGNCENPDVPSRFRKMPRRLCKEARLQEELVKACQCYSTDLRQETSAVLKDGPATADMLDENKVRACGSVPAKAQDDMECMQANRAKLRTEIDKDTTGCTIPCQETDYLVGLNLLDWPSEEKAADAVVSEISAEFTAINRSELWIEDTLEKFTRVAPDLVECRKEKQSSLGWDMSVAEETCEGLGLSEGTEFIQLSESACNAISCCEFDLANGMCWAASADCSGSGSGAAPGSDRVRRGSSTAPKPNAVSILQEQVELLQGQVKELMAAKDLAQSPGNTPEEEPTEQDISEPQEAEAARSKRFTVHGWPTWDDDYYDYDDDYSFEADDDYYIQLALDNDAVSIEYDDDDDAAQVIAEKMDTSSIQKNLVKMQFYFSNLHTEKYTEQQSMTEESFIANIGGTVGLLVGISVGTMFEIVECLAIMFVRAPRMMLGAKHKLARRHERSAVARSVQVGF